jgi:lipopolysaccharide export system protein LptA
MKSTITLLLTFLIAHQAFCLPDDKQKPIHFSAGEIEWDHLQSHGIFKKNVSFEQGSTKLYANSGFSKGDATHQFTKVVMYGSPKQQAHFITVPKAQDPKVDAYADTMIYLPIKILIILKGHVHVTQGRYQFSAPYVKYDTELKKLFTRQEHQEQTTIIVNPEKSS